MKISTSIKAIFIIIIVFSCKENPAGSNTIDTVDTLRVVTDHPGPDAITVPDTIDPVNSVKKEFARINDASLTKKTYTYTCDELITIDYYYEGANVVKAVVDFGTVGDHYQKSEFYYRDNKLVFYYDFVEGGPACEGCSIKTEKRYYVKDDLVIKFIKNKEQAKCTTYNFSQRSLPYRVLKAAATQDFKSAFCT